MSQSESSEEEADFLWLRPRRAGWRRDRGQRSREGKEERLEAVVGEERKKGK